MRLTPARRATSVIVVRRTPTASTHACVASSSASSSTVRCDTLPRFVSGAWNVRAGEALLAGPAPLALELLSRLLLLLALSVADEAEAEQHVDQQHHAGRADQHDARAGSVPADHETDDPGDRHCKRDAVADEGEADPAIGALPFDHRKRRPSEPAFRRSVIASDDLRATSPWLQADRPKSPAPAPR